MFASAGDDNDGQHSHNNSWSLATSFLEKSGSRKNPFSLSNGSNHDFDQLNEENTFRSASQFVDIDLIDYHELTSDGGDQGDADISAIDSYFRKKSSSLERLNFDTKPTFNNSNDLVVLQDERPPLFDKSASIGNLPSASSSGGKRCATPSTRRTFARRHSLHFTIARYSSFHFDFLSLTNCSTHRAVDLAIQFVSSGAHLPSACLTVHVDKLTLHHSSGPVRATNLATLLPLASGEYIIAIYCFPLWRRKETGTGAPAAHQMPVSPIVVHCHLNVIDVTVRRPFGDLNGAQLIELDCFNDDDDNGQLTRHDVLFQVDAPQPLDRPFTLQLSLDSKHSHSALITFATEAIAGLLPTVSRHFPDRRTCLITLPPSVGHFTVPLLVMQCRPLADEPSIIASVFSISTVDSMNAAADKCHRLADWPIQLNGHKKMPLDGSCIQAAVSGSEINGDQWRLRLHLRNKDHRRLVHVNLMKALLLAGEQVQPNWQCTQRHLTIRAGQTACLLLDVTEEAMKSAAVADSSSNDASTTTSGQPSVSPATLRLYVRQCSGGSQQLTSVLSARQSGPTVRV